MKKMRAQVVVLCSDRVDNKMVFSDSGDQTMWTKIMQIQTVSIEENRIQTVLQWDRVDQQIWFKTKVSKKY